MARVSKKIRDAEEEEARRIDAAVLRIGAGDCFKRLQEDDAANGRTWNLTPDKFTGVVIPDCHIRGSATILAEVKLYDATYAKPDAKEVPVKGHLRGTDSFEWFGMQCKVLPPAKIG